MRVIKILLVVFFISGGVSIIGAQELLIKGSVTDGDGIPLPDVNILLKETSLGTKTDFDGNYFINAEVGQTLVFSYIGFSTIEVVLGNSTTLNITMRSETSRLDEVVVIGFGETSKVKLTDNVVSAKAEDIKEIPTSNFQTTLVGKTPGVQITQVGGRAEAGVKIRVRGVATITGSQEPLYVLDGIPLINDYEGLGGSPINPLIGLNPDDIESIDILKDASSAAIYGARGTNGVVLITTKKGKLGKTKISLNSSYGWSTPTNRREFLNTAEYVELFTEAGLNVGFTEDDMAGFFNIWADNEEDWRNSSVNTDWQNLALIDGGVQNLGVNISGGNAKTRFFLSTGYNKTNAIVRGNRSERYNLRINLDHNVSDRFAVGINSSISKTQISRLANDNQFATPLQAIAQIPFTRPFSEGGIVPNGNTLYYNFLFQEFNADLNANIWRNNLNLFGEYNVVNDLSFRSEIGYDLNNQTEDRFFGSLTEFASTNGFANALSIQNEKYVLNNYLTYDRTFSKVDFDVVLGMSFEHDNRRLQNTQGQDFPSDDLQTLASAGEIVGGSTTKDSFNFLSYFLRANTAIANKYLFKASVRIDGSSRFGNENRYGTFPAFSGGWVISNEEFLFEDKTLSNLKLRASWGLTGNAEIGNYASQSLFGAARTYNQNAGLSISVLGDPELSWEKTEQYNFGLDLGFFENRLNLSVDYYVKNTEGLLLNVPVPSTSGVNSVLRNSGDLENKGWEFVLDTKNVLNENFSWSTSFNLSTNKNEVKALPNGADIVSFQNIVREGETVSAYYLVEYAGVDPENGDALFYRNSELPDGNLDKSTTNNFGEASRIVTGNPFPTVLAGMTNNFNIGQFDLGITFQGQWGASIFNGGGQFQSSNADFFDNQTRDQLNRWQEPGDITNVPQARLFGANGTQQSTRYLQKADFIRLRNLSFGYSFPKEITKKFNIQRFRIYLTGLNVLTITDYTNGWDPESRGDFITNNNLNPNLEFYSAPPAKTFTLGFNVDF
ncbi:SusC/RagA family TonB-linked outer membrane protein [Croceivirga thetidis]|uniref:TonB-dependent receptor n=1 Tax=Croceivirga thetidis TaxID=2721623 RepID=A0ABX1GTX0_9FLAO|nr:TonB-dependent receptor [Croceivirga thetidis]NKI32466.1 TonB-dependent receptor [Croceivirga thetidis]